MRKVRRLEYICGVHLVLILAILPFIVLSAYSESSAQGEKSFYEGKLIKIIVPTNPGGTYDAYPRLLAKAITKYLPGSTAIVKNVPGAGHLIGTKEIYHAKPNGLTFGDFNRGLIVGQIVGQRGMDFDLTKMSWLGSCASVPRALVVGAQTPFKSLKDILESEQTVRFSSSGVGTTSHTDIVLIGRMLGAKNWKPVVGYRGAEAEAAMMRGELDAQFVTWSSARPFVERGEFRVLYFTTNKPILKYEDVPMLPNIVTPEYQDIAAVMLMQAEVSYPFAGPPGIPADRFRMLREAFEKSWHDPDLLKVAEKARLSVNYIGHEEALNKVKAALNQKPEAVELFKAAYGMK